MALVAAERHDVTLGQRVALATDRELDGAAVMHAAAMPEADPSSLQRPSEVARRIIAMIEHPERAPSGARLAAPQWVVS